MSTIKKILILGAVPLPIGGVTVHVKRLLEHLSKEGVIYTFVSLHNSSKWTVLAAILRYKYIHLNTSNASLMYWCAIICKWLSKKLIITYHGNFGRKKGDEGLKEKKAIAICHIPLFLNSGSMQQGRLVNPRARQISAFIPPGEIAALPKKIRQQVEIFKQHHDVVFCTNAFNVSIDVNHDETYGISGIFNVFQGLEKKGLIFSDPTGNYQQYLKEKGIERGENILIINQPHDFVEVIKQSDAFIRATTTDGDSLSVKESLYFKTPVIASDCVQRHPDCQLYPTHDWNALKALLIAFIPHETDVDLPNGAEEIIKIYQEL